MKKAILVCIVLSIARSFGATALNEIVQKLSINCDKIKTLTAEAKVHTL